MMLGSGPEPTTPEMKIFLAALRAYSMSCVSPLLHADCPFAVQDRGEWFCGEECDDILSTHQTPPAGPTFELGSVTEEEDSQSPELRTDVANSQVSAETTRSEVARLDASDWQKLAELKAAAAEQSAATPAPLATGDMALQLTRVFPDAIAWLDDGDNVTVDLGVIPTEDDNGVEWWVPYNLDEYGPDAIVEDLGGSERQGLRGSSFWIPGDFEMRSVEETPYALQIGSQERENQSGTILWMPADSSIRTIDGEEVLSEGTEVRWSRPGNRYWLPDDLGIDLLFETYPKLQLRVSRRNDRVGIEYWFPDGPALLLGSDLLEVPGSFPPDGTVFAVQRRHQLPLLTSLPGVEVLRQERRWETDGIVYWIPAEFVLTIDSHGRFTRATEAEADILGSESVYNLDVFVVSQVPYAVLLRTEERHREPGSVLWIPDVHANSVTLDVSEEFLDAGDPYAEFAPYRLRYLPRERRITAEDGELHVAKLFADPELFVQPGYHTVRVRLGNVYLHGEDLEPSWLANLPPEAFDEDDILASDEESESLFGDWAGPDEIAVPNDWLEQIDTSEEDDLA